LGGGGGGEEEGSGVQKVKEYYETKKDFLSVLATDNTIQSLKIHLVFESLVFITRPDDHSAV